MKKLLFTFFILAMVNIIASAQWQLKTDSGVTVPLADVKCLVESDMSAGITVLLADGSVINNVNEVSFTMVSGIYLPNESKDSFKFAFSANSQIYLSNFVKGSTVGIFNTAGQQIYSFRADGHDMTINIDNLTSGFYILKVDDSSVKFVKK